MRLLVAGVILMSIWFTETSTELIEDNEVKKIKKVIDHLALSSDRHPVIAVVDTGYDVNDQELEKYIYTKDGKKVEFDFTGEGVHDTNGHGTEVIKNILVMNPNARIVPIKIYSEENIKKGKMKDEVLLKAFHEAIKLPEVSIVNYSSSGTDRLKLERLMIKAVIRSGKLFVTSAGNEGREITDNRPMYPASYKLPGMIVVAGERDKKVFTNWSQELVDFSLDGDSRFVYKKNKGYIQHTGSSISAGYVSGLASLYMMKNPGVTPEDVYNRFVLFSEKNHVTKNGSISIENFVNTLDEQTVVARK